jgi:hypothetical protein
VRHRRPVQLDLVVVRREFHVAVDGVVEQDLEHPGAVDIQAVRPGGWRELDAGAGVPAIVAGAAPQDSGREELAELVA